MTKNKGFIFGELISEHVPATIGCQILTSLMWKQKGSALKQRIHFQKNHYWSDGKIDGAQGGFGLTAEPDVTVETISSEDDLIVLGTDGLWEKMENQEVIDICLSTGMKKPLEDVCKDLVKVAQDRGTTDDISVIVLRMPKVSSPESPSIE